VGFWSALGYWGMTEQLPQTTYVTVMKRVKNLTFDNQRIRFVTYPRGRFFDYIQEKVGETEFNISSREKTIIDSLAHPQYSGGISEVAKAIWTARDKLNIPRMINDAEKMRILAVKLRLGYLLELLNFDMEVCSRLLPRKPTGAPWLDPSARKEALSYSGRWGLKLNVPMKVILHWK